MQPTLEKVIDKNQFCSVLGKSIVNYNRLIRDIVYYVNGKDDKAAFLKTAWQKAFNLVNIEFLFRTLEKMGFVEEFICLIKMLYYDIESAVFINNQIGRYSNVTR